MKNVKLKLALLGVLTLVSSQAFATGLVPLPATGATGSTAYLECFAVGQTITSPVVAKNNYGSSGVQIPTTIADNTCKR